MVQGAGAGNGAALEKEPHESLEKYAHAGCGLCRAADRRAVRWRRHRRGPGADPGPAKRDPLELPLRFHGELFRRAEGRERSAAMSERQCREALLRLPAGRKGGDAGASSKASRTFCHSDTCGSRSSPSGRHAGGARGRNTAGSCRCSGCSGRSTATQAAAKPAAPVASTPPAAAAKPASVKPAAPAAPPAKSAAKPPASAPVPAAAPPAVIVVAPRQVFVLVRTKCRAEYRAYCSDVDIGGGRVVACLQSNAASLSPTCQSGLAELGR